MSLNKISGRLQSYQGKQESLDNKDILIFETFTLDEIVHENVVAHKRTTALLNPGAHYQFEVFQKGKYTYIVTLEKYKGDKKHDFEPDLTKSFKKHKTLTISLLIIGLITMPFFIGLFIFPAGIGVYFNNRHLFASVPE